MLDRNFDKDSTAEQVSAGIDLSGRRARVTGASGGLGAETARVVALRGAAVALAARAVAKGEGVAEELRQSVAAADVDVIELELSLPASVRAFAEAYLKRHETLHLLINNAGVMACPLARTAEGWEMQFATNHLGHFLLSGLLLPALRAGAPSRVVNVSSRGHRFSPVVFEDIHFRERDYDKWVSYGQAKTANVLFALEWERRFGGEGIHAYALHPGAIVTELGRHMSEEDRAHLMSQAPPGGFLWKTVPAGAATSVYAATAPELEGRGGLYLEDAQVSELRTDEGAETGYEAWAMDPEAARRLWEVSEETLGVTF
jgi:NAD(P)-dependent dehydrogenase (short-subunit alcohol dehydrogenase family)